MPCLKYVGPQVNIGHDLIIVTRKELQICRDCIEKKILPQIDMWELPGLRHIDGMVTFLVTVKTVYVCGLEKKTNLEKWKE